MTKKAFLSGLGVMGRRHLSGLLKAGYTVTALDPRNDSVEAARKAIDAEGLALSGFQPTATMPKAEFDVAIFSETAPHRLGNLTAFLGGSRAGKLMLEKPLTTDPQQLGAFTKALSAKGVAAEKVDVNLSRRTWKLFRDIESRCREERSIVMSVNGGATGFGCNGIHHLDLFLFLTRAQSWTVPYAKLSPEPIPSGRGTEFSDFGVTFVIEADGHSLVGSLTADSSAGPVTTVKGRHFIATFDESDLNFRVRVRKSTSQKALYFCGHDYETTEEGTLAIGMMSQLTADWADGKATLPSLADGLRAHQMLFDVLAASQAPTPYLFT